MAPYRSALRPTAPAFLLALVLVLGSVAPTIARDTTPVREGLHVESSARTIATRSARGETPAGPARDARAAWRLAELVRPVEPTVQPRAEVRPATPDVPIARAIAIPNATASTASASTASSGGAADVEYRGRNHVWIPSLGVSRSVASFACTSKSYPGNRVYRWGCAGSNNIYLFGHAHSVFEPLHDAYVSGGLRKGMSLFYAGNDGVVRRYTVSWWKVTKPDKGAWAFASQSRPSLTLQTCVGAKSQYRLVVRLVQSD